MKPVIFLPKDLGEIQAMGDVAFASGAFPSLKNAAQATMIIQMGLELGLSPMVSLRNIKIMRHGGVSMPADLMAALIIQSPECEVWELVTSTREVATFRTQRKGKAPREHSFTIQEARDAGLYTDEVQRNSKGEVYKTTWQAYTAQMLRARAITGLARLEYPDLMAGYYDPDELEIRTTEPAPNQSPQPSPEHLEAMEKDQANREYLKKIAEERGADWCREVCDGIDRRTPQGRAAAVDAIKKHLCHEDQPGGEASQSEEHPTEGDPPTEPKTPSSYFDAPKPNEWAYGKDPVHDAAIAMLAQAMQKKGVTWKDVCADTREIYDFPSPFFLRVARIEELTQLVLQSSEEERTTQAALSDPDQTPEMGDLENMGR